MFHQNISSIKFQKYFSFCIFHWAPQFFSHRTLMTFVNHYIFKILKYQVRVTRLEIVNVLLVILLYLPVHMSLCLHCHKLVKSFAIRRASSIKGRSVRAACRLEL